MTAFFDFRGVVHYEYLPPRQTFNREYYLSVMGSLREVIRLKRPELWTNNSYNAPFNTALVPRDRFIKNTTHIVPQPPYYMF